MVLSFPEAPFKRDWAKVNTALHWSRYLMTALVIYTFVGRCESPHGTVRIGAYFGIIYLTTRILETKLYMLLRNRKKRKIMMLFNWKKFRNMNLRLYWFQQCLTQVTVDNGVNMHIHVNINTCNNVYHVFINFKLRVFFSRSIR